MQYDEKGDVVPHWSITVIYPSRNGYSGAEDALSERVRKDPTERLDALQRDIEESELHAHVRENLLLNLQTRRDGGRIS